MIFYGKNKGLALAFKGEDGKGGLFKGELLSNGVAWEDYTAYGGWAVSTINVESGVNYLLVEETLGILGTISIAFDSDYATYQTIFNKKGLQTTLGTFTFVNFFNGYFYIGIEREENPSEILANLKIYKLTVEA